jgi:hypothetical protein
MKKRLLLVTVLAVFSMSLLVAAEVRAGLLDVNYRALVSRADIIYSEPATRSEEGLPVGNGRMGSLVWTEPTQLKFQINHVNVYGINCETDSFPIRHSDYASTCAYLDITFVDYGDDVFETGPFKQHLSVYDGLMTAQGKGVTARVLAWPHRDVMAVEVEDTRQRPTPISIDLRMLRYMIQYHERLNWELTKNHQVMVRTASHTATSGLDIRDGRIVLTQQFREDDFYGASAVVVAVLGRKSQARYQNDCMVRLTAAPGHGKFTILIGSAASFDSEQDIAAAALKELNAAAAKSFAVLQAETADWWHDFWSKGFVYMHSPDSQADFVEKHYTYFLYLMGASSRGDYPPRFGGMIWYTTGDMRAWGSEHWWANTNAYYSNLMPSNRLELMEPMFSMYTKMYDSCARAAAQQWSSQGIWIPETVWFDGLENLPDDIAEEMRDLYLVRKPWDQASEKFLEYARTKLGHYSRFSWKDKGKWVNGRWIYTDKGKGAFGHTSHILGAGARIAELYWQRYQYTMDKDWLRDRAYPMLKASAEFYRNFPNFQKGQDGKYHIHHVNNGEGSWDSSDTPYEVSFMHMIFPLAIRASQILGVDAEMRPIWQEIKDNLVETPTQSRRRDGQAEGLPAGQASGQAGLDRIKAAAGGAYPTDKPLGRRAYGAFVYGGEGAITPLPPEEDLKSRFLGFNRLASFIDTAGIGGAKIFRNRLRLREGPGAIDAEHIGGLTSGIHETMLSSSPEQVNPATARAFAETSAETSGEPVLQIFNSWPKSWDAAFTLLARGAFLVSSSMENGQIGFVQIQSKVGGQCRLCNPWPGQTVILYRNGNKAEELSGSLLAFPTALGETVIAAPQGLKPARKSIL